MNICFNDCKRMILEHMKNNNRINIVVIGKIVKFVIKIIYYFLTRFCTTLIKHFYFFNFNLFSSAKISLHKQKT